MYALVPVLLRVQFIMVTFTGTQCKGLTLCLAQSETDPVKGSAYGEESHELAAVTMTEVTGLQRQTEAPTLCPL